MYYIYILKCTDNSLYTGITTDVVRRFAEHCSQGTLAAKYTRSHKADAVVAVWSTHTRACASKLEYFIKKLTRTKKEELVAFPVLLNTKYLEQLSGVVYNWEPSLIIKN